MHQQPAMPLTLHEDLAQIASTLRIEVLSRKQANQVKNHLKKVLFLMLTHLVLDNKIQALVKAIQGVGQEAMQ